MKARTDKDLPVRCHSFLREKCGKQGIKESESDHISYDTYPMESNHIDYDAHSTP